MKVNEIETRSRVVVKDNSSDNMKIELDTLRRQEAFWKEENAKLKDIIANSKSTDSKVIVREFHNTNTNTNSNSYGLSK